MDSIATGTPYWRPEATPDSYTLQDWTQRLHNMAQTPRDHPRYPEVRALMDKALQQVTMMHHQQNMADKMDAADNPYQPGPLQSALAGGAQGMSMGLGTALGGDDFQAYLAQARTDHPVATAAGNIAGGAIPATIMAGMPLFAGAPLVAAGITAGTQGTLEGGPKEGAIAAGATLIGGKIIGKAASMVGLDKVAGRALAAIATKLGVGEEIVRGMPISQLRKMLAAQLPPGEDVEKAVQAVLRAAKEEKLLSGAAQPADAAATRPQVKGTMGPLSQAAPAAGAETPTTPASKLADDLLELQGKLGRALTADEKERVLAAKLGRDVSPHDPQAAARSAYHLSEAAGDKDPRIAARRAAGTYSNWDPRQALGAAPLLSTST